MSELALGQDEVANALSDAASQGATWRNKLAWCSYWIIMGVSFALTVWLAQDDVLGGAAWYVMAQVNVLLVALFELILPRDSSAALLRDRQSWNDAAHMILFKLLIRPMAWWVVLAMLAGLAHYWPNTGRVWPAFLPAPVQFVALLIVFDLLGYLYHRALHRFDALFVFHALHHDTPAMHVLKSNRLHFGESFLNFLLVVPALIIVGCPPEMMIWLGMYEVFEGNLAHSNVAQRFPRWFHYIVRTADVHRIHHSTEGSRQNSNFGGVPLWDVVFGTYRHPAETQTGTMGLQGNPVPKSFFSQLLFPFAMLVRKGGPRIEPAEAEVKEALEPIS